MACLINNKNQNPLMKTRITGITALFLLNFTFSQQVEKTEISRKTVTAIKVSEAPKMDGILDEEAWKNVPSASDFIERRPNNGAKIPENFRSEVKVLYDDTGVYFGAT